MNAAHRKRSLRRGVTLIELLVVVSILMLLMVFAVPAARPALEARRLREAARQVSTYLARAQTEAARTGRPVGVELRRDASVPQMCTVLQQVEVPPAYAGDTLSSRMISVRDAGNPWLAQIAFPSGETLPDLVARDLIHVGDLLQLNYQGHYWRIEAIDAPNNKLLLSSHTAPGTPNVAAPGLPFQIFRRPEKASAAPLRLPEKTAIDLAFSGSDTNLFCAGVENPVGSGNWVADSSPVMLMFAPNGNVDCFYWRGMVRVPALEPIYLLIGLPERVPRELNPGTPYGSGYTSLAEDGLLNHKDLKNLIVAIRPQSGLITTSEVASSDLPTEDFRDIAREAQTMGGR